MLAATTRTAAGPGAGSIEDKVITEEAYSVEFKLVNCAVGKRALNPIPPDVSRLRYVTLRRPTRRIMAFPVFRIQLPPAPAC